MQVVFSGSWRTSRRGRCAGSFSRRGCCRSPAGRPGCSASISAATAARSLSSVSSSRLFCSALKRSLWAANFSRLRMAFSWVSLSMTACLNAASARAARSASRSCWASSVSRSSAITRRDAAQPVPLPQQHQLEHRQRRVRLGTTSMRGLTLVQTLELVRDLGPVQQLVQLHRRRVLDQRLGAHQEEALHALIAPHASRPRIGGVMHRSRFGSRIYGRGWLANGAGVLSWAGPR